METKDAIHISEPSLSIDEKNLTADEIQLRAQGHVGELPRQFSAFSTLALAFSITNSWVGYAATFVTPLFAGAGPAIFWAPIVACVACFFITAGLAEHSSAFPSTGGQYHFAFMVAPANYRAAIAFSTGWLSAFAWLFTTASANLFCAQICVNLATLYHFIYFGATIGLVVTSGRLLWAFARDNGLPYSKIFAKTHPTLKVPVNATLLTAVFCILYGLIYIGSTTAFNSFVATAILSLNITYAIPQFIALYRGRSKVLPARHFDLGNVFGSFCNAFSTLWVALYAVLFCFPIFLPVTAQSMNYVSVVMAGTMLFIVLMWWVPGGKRGVFRGPKVDMQLLNAANRCATCYGRF